MKFISIKKLKIKQILSFTYVIFKLILIDP